jgi:hypothetical protein
MGDIYDWTLCDGPRGGEDFGWIYVSWNVTLFVVLYLIMIHGVVIRMAGLSHEEGWTIIASTVPLRHGMCT